MVLVLDREISEPPDHGVAPIGPHDHVGSDFEWLLSVPYAFDTHHCAAILDELGNTCTHPALEAGERTRLPNQGL